MIILSAGAGSVEFIVDNSSFADFHLENSKATKIICHRFSLLLILNCNCKHPDDLLALNLSSLLKIKYCILSSAFIYHNRNFKKEEGGVIYKTCCAVCCNFNVEINTKIIAPSTRTFKITFFERYYTVQ